MTVWFGKGSTGDEREMAKVKNFVRQSSSKILLHFQSQSFFDYNLPLNPQALAVTKNPEPELMFEGQEKGSFWSDLGGAVKNLDQDDDDGGLQGRRSTSQTWCLARRKIKLSRGSSSSPGEVEQRAGGTCEKVGRDRHHMCPVQCLWQHHSGRGC